MDAMIIALYTAVELESNSGDNNTVILLGELVWSWQLLH